jgi:hypothetical protein
MRAVAARALFVLAAVWAIGWVMHFVGTGTGIGLLTPIDYGIRLVTSPFALSTSGDEVAQRVLEYLSFLPSVIFFVAGGKVSGWF